MAEKDEALDLVNKETPCKSAKERLDHLEKIVANLVGNFENFSMLIIELLSSLVKLEDLSRVEEKYKKLKRK